MNNNAELSEMRDALREQAEEIVSRGGKGIVIGAAWFVKFARDHAELEAERDRLREAVINEVWDREQARRAVDRIAELEAELRLSQQVPEMARVRIAELEAEVARLTAEEKP